MENGIDVIITNEELEIDIQEDFLKGDKGEKGDTPIKGIDYYTEQDKQEFKDELTEIIQLKKDGFDKNAEEKTNEFNNNVNKKMQEYNENAVDKIEEYNANAEELFTRILNLEDENIQLQTENTRLKEDLNSLPSEQVEGESIDITDSAEMRFNEFKVMGNSKQETSTDNLFDTIWEQGLISTETGEEVTVTTTIRCDYIRVFPNYLYSISRSKYSSYMAYRFYDKNKNYLGNQKVDGMMDYSTSDGRMDKNVASMTFTILNSEVAYMRIIDDTNDLSTIYTLTTEAISPDYPSEIKSCGGNVNLFDFDNMISGYVLNTGAFSTDSNLGEKRSDFIKVLPNTSYTFKIHETNQSNNDWIGIGEYSSNDTSTFVQRDVKSSSSFTEGIEYTITTTSTTQYIVVSSRNLGDKAKVKLEKSPVATPYSPYGQGCINEVVGNKNLINIDEIEWKVYYTADGTLDTSENWGISKIKALSNTQYYLSGNKVNNSNACIVLLNKNKEFIKTVGYYNKVQLINTTNDTCYIGISIPKYTNGQGDDTTTIMLEQGSTATDYVEHQSQTFTIPTQQPMRAIGDYKDTFIKVDGKWFEKHYIERKVFDGTEDWAYHRENYRFYKTLERIPLVSQAGKVLSSHFKNGNTETDNNTFNIGSKEIFFRNENITSISDWKTWLLAQYEAGTPVYVDYVLSEPTNLECTEEQNKILEELENAKSYKGVTHIYSTDEVEPNVEVIYKKDMQIENEKLQSQIDEIKQLLSTTQTSALLLDNLQTDIESEVE